jgi:hypothetical protein
MYRNSIMWAAAIAVALVGCEETESAGGDGGGGTGAASTGVVGGSGGVGGGGQGGAGGAAPCNTLLNDAAEVEVTQVAETMPAATGGRIADGRYHLSQVNLYTGPGGEAGPTGARQKETSLYTGTSLEVVVDLFQGDGEQHFSLGVTAGDEGSVSFAGVCPGPISFPFDRFTFTEPSTLALYYTAVQMELIYTRVGDS